MKDSNMLIVEEWRPVVGYEDRYEVSSLGRVRAWRGMTFGRHVRYDRPRLKRPTIVGGYPRTSLTNGTTQKSAMVHRLVLEAFVGPCPRGHESGHLDGNRQNCNIDNLAWITKSENQQHRFLHGTDDCGARNHHASLTWQQAAEARAMFVAGVAQVRIAEQFNVTKGVINRIVHGQSYVDRTIARERGA